MLVLRVAYGWALGSILQSWRLRLRETGWQSKLQLFALDELLTAKAVDLEGEEAVVAIWG